MYSDESGCSPLKWYHWLAIGVGAALVVASGGILIAAAAGYLTTGTLIGAVAIGAAKGALIGAAIGTGVGGIGGAIYSGVTGADFWTSVGQGAALGFGIGAVIGAVAGGVVGYNSWYTARALEFTQMGVNNEVVLGNYIKGSPHSYEAMATSRGSTSYSISQTRWSQVKAMKGVGDKGMWKINQVFLKQQMALNKTFVLSSDYLTVSLTKEIGYLLSKGIIPFLI